MAESREDMVRRLYADWNAGERQVYPDLTHPDIELHTRFAMLGGEPYRGYEGIRQWMRDIDEQFGQWRLEITEIREQGDRMLVLGSIHIRGRESGVELDQPIGWIWDFRDDKFVRLETQLSHDEAIEAAGRGFAEP